MSKAFLVMTMAMRGRNKVRLNNLVWEVIYFAELLLFLKEYFDIGRQVMVEWVLNIQLKFGTKHFVMIHTLLVSWRSLETWYLILGPWFWKTLRIKAQAEFQDVRGCSRTYRDHLKWKRTFRPINFVKDTQLPLWEMQECQQDGCVAWILYIMIVYRSIKFTKRTYVRCFSETFWRKPLHQLQVWRVRWKPKFVCMFGFI